MKKKVISKLEYFYLKIKQILSISKCLCVMFVFGIFNIPLKAFPQSEKIDLKLVNIPISKVFNQIEEKTDYTFLYNEKYINENEKVSVVVENTSVHNILKNVLSSLDLKYKINENLIIICKNKNKIRKEELLQNKIKVKGKVVDQDGVSLPGVSISIKGTQQGVSTDINGDFELEIENKCGIILVFSCLGMKTREIKLSKKKYLKIVLQEDTTQLGEVVVTGYQTISRERATGSFATIKSDVIDSKISVGVESRIQGMVSGLKVNNEGEMTIRGISTLYASKKPLIVVDGFPIESDIKSINPNDIKSINILKDAAAASIWGVRASNGVIVITTKKGSKSKKPKINFSYNLTVKDKPDLSKYRYASPADQIDLELETFAKGWVTSPQSSRAYPSSRVADVIFSSSNYIPWVSKGNPYDYLSKDEIAKIEQLKKENGLDEYEKYFTRTSINNQYNLSINGGSEDVNYYISGIYDNNKSNIVRESFDRVIINSKLNAKINNFINLSSGFIFSNIKQNINSSIKPLFGYGKYFDSNGKYKNFPRGINQKYKNEYASKEGYVDWNYNPLQDFRNTSNVINTNNYRVFFNLNTRIVKGLDLDVKYQYEKFHSKGSLLHGKETHTVRHSYNLYTGKDGKAENLVHSFPMGEINQVNINEIVSSSLRGQLNFSKNIGKHSIKALAGWEYRKISSNSSEDTYFGYSQKMLVSTLTNWSSINNNKVPTWNGSEYVNGYYYKGPKFKQNEERYVSFYTNFGYSYDEKYDFTFSGRLDDSNLFGAEKKYRLLPLWSLGLGWNITNEVFFGTDIFNLLRLKVSYGFNGNIDRTTVPSMKAMIIKDMYTNKIVAEIENPGNPNLRWEKTAVTNFAVDFAILNNRISGTLELYRKNSVDLLGDKTVNPIFGYTSIRANVAKVSNNGFEIQLNTIPLKLDNFEWGVNLNLSYNKNKVEEVYSGVKKLSYVLNGMHISENKPIDGIYAYRWAGLSKNGDSQVYNKEGNKVEHISDTIENIDDLKYIGPSIAPWNGGLNSTFSYKGINIALLFLGSLGHYFRMPELSYKDKLTVNGGNIRYKEIKDRWRKPGDEKNTDIPKVGNSPYSDSYTYFNKSDLRIRRADFISLKEISLSYKFDKKILKKLPFRDVTFVVQLRNIAKWFKNPEGIDPESIPSVHFPQMGTPEQMTISFGVKANF